MTYTTKKGITVSFQEWPIEDCQEVNAMHYHQWLPWSDGSDPGVGVLHNATIKTPAMIGQAVSDDDDYLFTFNEPDMPGATHIPYWDAAAYYKQIVETYPDKKWILPSVSGLPQYRNWLGSFIVHYKNVYGEKPPAFGLAFHCHANDVNLAEYTGWHYNVAKANGYIYLKHWAGLFVNEFSIRLDWHPTDWAVRLRAMVNNMENDTRVKRYHYFTNRRLSHWPPSFDPPAVLYDGTLDDPPDERAQYPSRTEVGELYLTLPD